MEKHEKRMKNEKEVKELIEEKIDDKVCLNKNVKYENIEVRK
jgi:hypothetical protein